MKDVKISPQAVSKIDTLDQLLQNSYQMIHLMVLAMDKDQCLDLQTQLKVRIEYVYRRINSPGIRTKDLQIIMSGIKKLEVVYGYIFDRLNDTEMMKVR